MMKPRVLALIAALLTATAALAWAGTETCFGKGEKLDGLNKICYYDCPSGEAAITVSASKLCPLSIHR